MESIIIEQEESYIEFTPQKYELLLQEYESARAFNKQSLFFEDHEMDVDYTMYLLTYIKEKLNL